MKSSQSLFSYVKRVISLPFFLVILVCIILFVSHSLYISHSFSYPHEDEHVYLFYAARAYDLLKTPSLQRVQQVAGLFTDRQPLYPLVVSFFLFLFGDGNMYIAAMFVTYLFYAVSIVALYFLAKEFVKPFPAFLASFIFAFYGFPLYYLHSAYTEPAATAFVVLCLLFLKKSEYLSQRRFVLFFSISFLLGSLTRWVVPLFIIGPLFYVFIISLFIIWKSSKWKNYVVNLGVFLFIGIVLPLLIYYIPRYYYFSNYVHVLRYYGKSWITTIAGYTPDLANTFSVHSAMYYVNVISQQTIYFFALFVIGLIISIIFWKKYSFAFLAFFIPYVIFTFFSVYKKDRFIVPIYPSMALLSVFVFPLIRNKLFYALLTGLIITFGMLNFFGASWGMGPLGHQGLKDIVLPKFVPHPRRIYLTTIIWPPSKDSLRADNIIEAIDMDWRDSSHTALMLNTFTIEPQELDNAFTSILYYEGKYKRRTKINFQNLRSIQHGDYKELCSRIASADYLLITGAPIIKEASYTTAKDDSMIEVFNKAFEKNKLLPSSYVVVGTFYIPFYKHTLILYRKIRPLVQEDWNIIRDMFIKNDSQAVGESISSCGQ